MDRIGEFLGQSEDIVSLLLLDVKKFPAEL
jgi:hypothetical protein